VLDPAFHSIALVALIAFVAVGGLLQPRRTDLIALTATVALALSGIVPGTRVLAQLGNGAIVTLIAVFVLAAALERSGVSYYLGRWIGMAGRRGLRALVGAVVIAGAGGSLFMNNIAAVALLLPAISLVAREQRIAASRLYLPLAYATSLGGMATLLTTANLVTSGALEGQGLRGYGVLDFLPVGGPLALFGIAYFVLIAPRLPDRRPHVQDSLAPADLSTAYQLRERSTFVRLTARSPLCGQTLGDSQVGARYGLSVLAVQRAGRWLAPVPVSHVLAEGDALFVIGRDDRVVEWLAAGYAERASLAAESVEGIYVKLRLAEVVLAPRSRAVGRTLRELSYRALYNASVIAIWREDRAYRTDVADMPLRLGDSLLIQLDDRAALHSDDDFLVLADSADRPGRSPQRAWLAALIFLGVIVLGALRVYPESSVLFAGVVAMLLTGCITTEQAYRAVDWRTVFSVAALLPLSLAIVEGGLAGQVAQLAASIPAINNAYVLVAVLGLLSMAVAQLIGGQVAAVLMSPIAIVLARQFGFDARAVAMAVALGSGMTFLTVASHPSNLYVLGPGGYTSRDFFRIGITLVLGILVLMTAILGSLA
jgi:di/tricarboxylate transporter